MAVGFGAGLLGNQTSPLSAMMQAERQQRSRAGTGPYRGPNIRSALGGGTTLPPRKKKATGQSAFRSRVPAQNGGSARVPERYDEANFLQSALAARDDFRNTLGTIRAEEAGAIPRGVHSYGAATSVPTSMGGDYSILDALSPGPQNPREVAVPGGGIRRHPMMPNVLGNTVGEAAAAGDRISERLFGKKYEAPADSKLEQFARQGAGNLMGDSGARQTIRDALIEERAASGRGGAFVQNSNRGKTIADLGVAGIEEGLSNRAKYDRKVEGRKAKVQANAEAKAKARRQRLEARRNATARGRISGTGGSASFMDLVNSGVPPAVAAEVAIAEKEIAFKEKGLDREDARVAAEREFEKENREDTQEHELQSQESKQLHEMKIREREDELVREGYDRSDARAKAEREHELILEDRADERTESAEDRADRRAEAERIFQGDLSREDRESRERESQADRDLDKDRLAAENAHREQMFKLQQEENNLRRAGLDDAADERQLERERREQQWTEEKDLRDREMGLAQSQLDQDRGLDATGAPQAKADVEIVEGVVGEAITQGLTDPAQLKEFLKNRGIPEWQFIQYLKDQTAPGLRDILGDFGPGNQWMEALGEHAGVETPSQQRRRQMQEMLKAMGGG